jgi:uncharacterized protein (TIGR03437 family)
MVVFPAAATFSTVFGGAPFQQQLSVEDTGGGTLTFAAQNLTSSAAWISIQAVSGTATPGAPGTVSYTVDPSTLAPGIYTATIVVSSANANQSVSVPVTISVSAQAQSILLSQIGFPFTAVAQGPTVPPQVFAILNAGAGAMQWTTSASTLSGGAGWLTVSPSSGTSTAGSSSPPLVTLTVNQANLVPGAYYGSITVSAPGAANSPQSVLVQFNVLPPIQSIAPLASTAGMLFVAVSGGPDPPPQTLILNDPNVQSVSFNSTVNTDDNTGWFTQTPTSGTIASGETSQIQIKARLASLTPGVRYGVLRVAFSDGTVHSIEVASIVAPPGTTAAPTAAAHLTAAGPGCPSRLVVQPTTIEPNFKISVGDKVPIGAIVSDDCGHLINSPTASTVTLIPRNGNQVRLVPQGNGLWTGTWQPSATASATMVAITAVAIAPGTIVPVGGQSILSGSIGPAAGAAEAIPSSVFNAASFQAGSEVALGSFVSIFGSGMGDLPSVSATGTIYPTQLGTTRVLLGGAPLPLSYVGPNQINALVPSGISPNTQQQLIVQHGATQSLAIPVIAAEAQPGIYTVNQQGTGQGAIIIAGSNLLAAPLGDATSNSQPARQGDYIEIFGTGLGLVTAPPPDGSPALSNPLSTTLQPPQVTIGGVSATVAFSGLVPGLIGLYQINAQIPSAAPTGDAVPVIVTVGTAASNTATIAIQ